MFEKCKNCSWRFEYANGSSVHEGQEVHFNSTFGTENCIGFEEKNKSGNDDT